VGKRDLNSQYCLISHFFKIRSCVKGSSCVAWFFCYLREEFSSLFLNSEEGFLVLGKAYSSFQSSASFKKPEFFFQRP
jgi:hypothetical protein